MSCSNSHPNLSRKPKMSVKYVWRRKSISPKPNQPSHYSPPNISKLDSLSSPKSLNNSPNSTSPNLPNNSPNSSSPNFPNNPTNTPSPKFPNNSPHPPSPPHPNILHNFSSSSQTIFLHPIVDAPTFDQVGCHETFCHCCRYTQNHFHSLRNDINFIKFLITHLIPCSQNTSPPPFSYFS